MQKTLLSKHFYWGKIALDFYTGIAIGIVYDRGYKEDTIYVAMPFFILEIQKDLYSDTKLF